MNSPAPLKSSPPMLGDYVVERELTAGVSYLVKDSAGRRAVLKHLDDDCLFEGQLHPMIRDRLARVRELAHVGVATLYGVERIEGAVWLVWEYLEGSTLGEMIWYDKAAGDAPPEGRERLARELIIAVESLHALGIVHGDLHPENVVEATGGAVKLLHISPLLHNDPEVDLHAVARILDVMGYPGAPAAAQSGVVQLRELAARLDEYSESAMNTPMDDSPEEPEPSNMDAGRTRRIALVGAVLAAMAGAGIVWGILRLSDRPANVDQPRQER